MEENLNENQMEKILSNISTVVIEYQKRRLNETLSNVKIKNIICSMVHKKSSSPDGFPTKFFQRFWSILGAEVLDAVRELQSFG